jgi:hypothetical protein
LSGPWGGALSVSEYKRSSLCGESTCVEVALRSDGVRVRDAKAVGGPELAFTADEWTAFVAGVKKGEFDMADPGS